MLQAAELHRMLFSRSPEGRSKTFNHKIPLTWEMDDHHRHSSPMGGNKSTEHFPSSIRISTFSYHEEPSVLSKHLRSKWLQSCQSFQTSPRMRMILLSQLGDCKEDI